MRLVLLLLAVPSLAMAYPSNRSVTSSEITTNVEASKKWLKRDINIKVREVRQRCLDSGRWFQAGQVRFYEKKQEEGKILLRAVVRTTCEGPND